MSEAFPMPKNNVEAVKIVGEMHASLNPSQYNAAVATEGPVIVIAGAGTGKTKTLIHRVATLMIKGVPPTSIMIVTFTNKAAGEIKDRLQAMVGENAQYINAGTFHSIVYQKMLKMFPDSPYLQGAGIDMTECSILDEDDAYSQLKTAVKELDQAEQEWLEEEGITPKAIQAEMGVARSVGMIAEEYIRTIDEGKKKERFQRIVGNVWLRYNELCRIANGIDFDDILIHADRMLQADEFVAEKLGTDYRYLMLDEYQDTNPVQMSIMDQIAKYHRNIFTVGDEKQSIYSFRGADINVIMSFKKRYPEAQQIDMKQNYRSYPAIIQGANACAWHMGQRLSDGQLQHMRDIDETPEAIRRRRNNSIGVVEFSTTTDEAVMVVNAIERDIKEGVRPDHIAVLYRNKTLKKEIEKEMVRREMQYYVVNDRSFYERAEVKDAIALFRFVYNPWDSMAGLRILRATTLGLSEKKAKDMMGEKGINFSEVLRIASEQRLKAIKKGETEPQLTAAAKKIKPFYELSTMLRDSYAYGDDINYVMDCIRKLWEIYIKSRYEAKISKNKNADRSDEMSDRIENAKFVFDRVEESLKAGMSLREIIDEITMRSEYNPDMDKKKASKVQMMTIHGSKGLEYESVYMVGCSNVIMPGETDEPDVIEEERRLFYVGMTRAEKKLAISYSRCHYAYGEWQHVTSSPFIDEVVDRAGLRKAVMPETDIERQLQRRESVEDNSAKKRKSRPEPEMA